MMESNSKIQNGLLNTNNITSFSQRLKQIIGSHSIASFAQQCQLSESAIRKYVRGDSEPTLQNLLVIAKIGHVPVSWLATGREEFSTTPYMHQTNDTNLNVYQSGATKNYQVINEIDFSSLNENEVTYTPINQWTLSSDWLIREGLQHANLAITTIDGEGMSNTVKYGDLALINLKPEGWQGALEGVFIISLNNTQLIKRLQFDPIEQGYHLYSDSTTYKSYFIKKDADVNFKIIAKIEYILNKVV